jgi:hypothetical protein
VVGLLLGILAVAGAVAGWLCYPRPFQPPTFLALWVDQFKDRRLPILPWAEADRRVMQSVWPSSNDAFTSQQGRLFRQELESRSRQAPHHPVVVFLSTHARPLPQGSVGLLPADSNLDRPDTWVPLAEVFRILRDCRAEHKLLLLDIMQPSASPRSGILADETAALAWPELEKAVASDPHLSILTACAPGQVSLSSEGLGHTAFAHFIAQGLRGRADTGDGRVGVEELAAYVMRQVDRWAWHTFRQRQTPRLLRAESARDFPLVIYEQQETESEDEPQPREYPGWLLDAWKKRDICWKDGSFRLVVPAFVSLEQDLLQVEWQWRAGADAFRLTRLRDEVRRRLVALKEEMDRRRADLRPPGRLRSGLVGSASGSLAAAVPPDAPKVDPEVIRKVRDLARLGEQVRSTPKPAEADVSRLEREKVDLLKSFKDKPLELWRAVFSAAEAEPSRARLDFLAGLLPEGATRDHVELWLLQQVARLPGKVWPGRAVAQALRAVAEQEVIRAGDPHTFFWIGKPFREAEARFQQGLDRLLGPEAERGENLTADLETAAQSFRKVGEEQEAVSRALQARDRALVLIPALALYFEEAEMDPLVLEDLKRAIEAVERLRNALAGAVQGNREAWLAELRRLTGVVNDTDALSVRARSLSGGRVRNLIDKSDRGDPADGMSMRALLRYTSLDADQRSRLWKAWNRLDVRFQSNFPHSKQDANLPPWGESEQRKAQAAERARALWRGRLAVLALSLRDEHAGQELEPLLLRATESPEAEPRRALARKLFDLWWAGP